VAGKNEHRTTVFARVEAGWRKRLGEEAGPGIAPRRDTALPDSSFYVPFLGMAANNQVEKPWAASTSVGVVDQRRRKAIRTDAAITQLIVSPSYPS
jgi:hypothetical protein